MADKTLQGQLTQRVRWATPPIPGESLRGYLVRVVEHNQLGSVRNLTRAAGFASHQTYETHRATSELVERLAIVLRLDAAQLLLMSNPAAKDAPPGCCQLFGGAIREQYLWQVRRSFSPASLRISPT